MSQNFYSLALAAGVRPISKSFLVLFFKKELLSFFLQPIALLPLAAALARRAAGGYEPASS